MPATVKRAPRAALAALSLAALLAGCGGGSHATNTGASATTNSTGASAPTSSAPATTPATPTTPTYSSSSSQAVSNPATYGQLAGAAEQATITRVVQSYYSALSSGREAAACGMLTVRIQRLLTRSVGHNPLLHGKGCVGAFKLLFGRRGGASAVSPTVAVTGVRVSGDRAYALFSTQSIPSAQIRVEREHGVWKIGSLIGSPLGGSSGSKAG